MDKRTLTAVILSLIVLLGWTYIFGPEKVPQTPEGLDQESAPVTTEEKAAHDTKQVIDEKPISREDLIATSVQSRDVIVESDLYKAVFSTQGAVVKYWELKTYRESDDVPVVLINETGPIAPLGILFDGPNRNLPQKLLYNVNTESLTLSEQGKKKGELVFTYSNQGMTIKKTLVFYNDDFKVDMSFETINTPSYLLPIGTNFGVYNKEGTEHSGPIMLLGSDLEKFDADLEQSQFFTGSVNWIAQEDIYFTSAIIPVTPVDGVKVWKEREAAEIALKLAPQKHDFIFYAGPKEYDRLKSMNANLEHMVDFGWFAFIAMPLFWVLKYFYSFTGNYGWAIVLITIVTRIPFIPILHKSQKSMKKMQTIQPMMAELKEKYKNDSAKMQKEMMALYKKHKVNPIGGCLPMFLQIPVFIALYNVLLKAIELRGAPFVGWITDLAVKDPYYVLPIVMGASMVLQQKMTPTAMDPKQAKMMMLMPIVFTFMFLTFPAGLVIYWLVNNVLGIAQQHYANKQAD